MKAAFRFLSTVHLSGVSTLQGPNYLFFLSRMAAFRESIFRYISHYKNPASRLVFYRGFTSKLFVKGISFSTTEEKLSDAFSKFGQVTEAKIIVDKVRNKSKGYGYVSFSSEESAQKALVDMNGKVLDGRVIFVDNVRPNARSSMYSDQRTS